MIPAMTTDRLILREYNDADIDDYFRLKSDKETMYYSVIFKRGSRCGLCKNIS